MAQALGEYPTNLPLNTLSPAFKVMSRLREVGMTPRDETLRIAVEMNGGKVSIHVNTDKVAVEIFDHDHGSKAVPMSRYPNCVVKDGRKVRP